MPIQVQQGDQVFFRVIGVAADTLRCTVNFRSKNGQISSVTIDVVSATDRTATSNTIRLVEGEIISASFAMIAGTPPTRGGQVWTDALVQRGGSTIATLWQGYFYDGHDLTWTDGNAHLESKTEGTGRLYTASGSNPAAGAEVADTVPTGARWKLYAAEVVLVTSGVANRNTALFIDDAGATITRKLLLTDTTNQTDAQTRTHGWYPGTAAVDAASVSITDTVTVLAKFPMTLPLKTHLLAGDNIRTVTTNIQAGDDYGIPRYVVEEWFA